MVAVSVNRSATRPSLDDRAQAIAAALAVDHGIPDAVFAAATTTYLDGRRLDMRALAAEVGTSRATLYRKVGSREALLGEVIWTLTSQLLAYAIADAGERRGADRIDHIVSTYLHAVAPQPALLRFLEQEPECALRILTSKKGVVQARLLAAIQGILEEEIAAGRLDIGLDAATVAFVVVRVGESFLFADAIAGNPSDVGTAVTVIARLLRCLA